MAVKDAESGSEFLSNQCLNLTREVHCICDLEESITNDGLSQEIVFDASKGTGILPCLMGHEYQSQGMNTFSTTFVNPQVLTYLHVYPIR